MMPIIKLDNKDNNFKGFVKNITILSKRLIYNTLLNTYAPCIAAKRQETVNPYVNATSIDITAACSYGK